MCQTQESYEDKDTFRHCRHAWHAVESPRPKYCPAVSFASTERESSFTELERLLNIGNIHARHGQDSEKDPGFHLGLRCISSGRQMCFFATLNLNVCTLQSWPIVKNQK